MYRADREGDQKFYTPGGWINRYGLACGYMECVDTASGRVTLALDNCYHVRRSGDYYVQNLWECTDSLSQARAWFVRAVEWENERVANGGA